MSGIDGRSIIAASFVIGAIVPVDGSYTPSTDRLTDTRLGRYRRSQ
jgi:hypothetical protein